MILYTDQAFADITRAPSWAGALNDGRIRMPVQGLTSVTPELARVLKHELTHSFIGQKSHGRAPTWLQEGIAQWMEGRRSGECRRRRWWTPPAKDGVPTLANLEGSWMALSGNAAAFAYAWSLAVVESIIQAGGVGDIGRLLDPIATAPSTEAALREILALRLLRPAAANHRLLAAPRQISAEPSSRVPEAYASNPAQEARRVRQRSDHNMFVRAVRSIAHRAQAIERRHAQRRRKISIRAAAG